MKLTVSVKIFCFISLMIMPLLFCDFSCAETGYVSDMLILTMREGPGSNFNVIKTLRSNAPLEILEKGQTHFKVRTKEGDQGWIEKQYVTMEIPKAMVIEDLMDKIVTLEKALQESEAAGMASSSGASNDVQKYKKQTKALSDSLKKNQAEKMALQEENDRLNTSVQQLKASLDKLNSSVESGGLVTENEALRKKLEELTGTITSLSSPGNDPLKIGMIKWFVSGAGVLLAGWLMGKSMRTSRKKSRGLLG